MIYKLTLNEDTYSENRIMELARLIRNSISRYVDKVDDISIAGTGSSFDIIWDTETDKRATIEITDEHATYGLAPLEFNIYINGEEFGPMCYSSSEIACMEAKDFILSKLNQIFTSNVSENLEESKENQPHKIFVDGELFREIQPWYDAITYVDSVVSEIKKRKGVKDIRVVYSDGSTYSWKNSQVAESACDSEGAYAKAQVEQDLKQLTNDFTVKSELLKCWYESEQEYAYDILSDHYKNIKCYKLGDWYIVEFNTPISITTEALTDYLVGDPDDQRYIGNAQVIKASQLPKVGERFKAGITTSVNKIGFEDGYMIYEVGVTEPGSLEGFAEFDYDTAHWLFAIKNFNEALERENSAEEELNEFAYKIDDLKSFYNTATSIDKEKYPNFFAWFDEMKKSGKLDLMQFAH